MASVLPSLGYEDRGLNDNIAYEALDGTSSQKCD